MSDLFDHNLAEIEKRCRGVRQPQVHAKTLFRNTYKLLLDDPWTDRKLPKTLKRDLSMESSPLKAVITHQSRYDGSVKFVFALADGAEVETVLMPEKGRTTVCVSSQVGCAQACSFCYTGRMGLSRSLRAGEIVGQVVAASQWLKDHMDSSPQFDSHVVTNVVFMGMGEPLDNVLQVHKTLQILSDPYGLNIPLKRISVSTAGHFEGMKQLLDLQPNVCLALSLHASNPRERSRIMPINRKWPVTEILDYLKQYYEGTKRTVLIQYTLISGVNDSLEHAQELVELLSNMPIKLNLIPFNDVEPSRFRAPSPETVTAFRDFVHQKGIRVMVRYSKGQDIGAACGQLVRK